ncbi:MAG: recombinase family protein [Clostridiales bacterium]|nr:recombinase family protein [Clostridiales bacterium]
MFSEMQQGSNANKTGGNPERHFIPAKAKLDPFAEGRILKACAYCRVSTDSDMQLSSFELQTEHYQNLAGKHKNWDLRKIYADEGISGTSLKNRDQFNAMLEACWAGEYDLILTKSVSRFARNLVDCVSLVRRLKNHTPPIGVFFETDNLFTLSEDSELKLSLLATFAQEESIKKSESMVWSLSERFKSEKRLLIPEPYGYSRQRDASGRYVQSAKLQIVAEEAEVVRFIFDAFLTGYPLCAIAEILTEAGVPTKTGRSSWSEGSLNYILRNERYCGSILTWKTFTADVFEHKKKRNRQDRDQYLYTNQHEAIIPVEKFEAAQILLENKKHHLRGGLPVLHVIDDGIFRGFVPVDHHWINDDPNTYFEASNSIGTEHRRLRLRRNQFSAFNLTGYQVIRGQFMMRRAECPCITITDQKISFNHECQRKFLDVGYVQLLIHPSQRKLAIRPCGELDINSIRWRVDAERPISSKTLRCQYFSAALFQIMDWNPEYQYRVRGTWASSGQDEIIIFDVTNAVPVVTVQQSSLAAGFRRSRRIDLLPEGWESAFGEEFYAYSIHNGFYYLSSHTGWNAQAKSHLVPGCTKVSPVSEEELQMSIENIRQRTGVANAN